MKFTFIILCTTTVLQEDLDAYFGTFGTIKESLIMTDKDTGQSRGFINDVNVEGHQLHAKSKLPSASCKIKIADTDAVVVATEVVAAAATTMEAAVTEVAEVAILEVDSVVEIWEVRMRAWQLEQ